MTLFLGSFCRRLPAQIFLLDQFILALVVRPLMMAAPIGLARPRERVEFFGGVAE